MAWNFALTIGAAFAGLLGMRYVVHEPDFDFQLATPKNAPIAHMADGEGQGKAFGPESSESGRLVSIRLHDAHVADVLAWLENQGVNFIVSDDSLKERSMTLNIDNQRLDSVVDAIAAAMGGHWDRQGTIRVFEKGDAAGSSGTTNATGLERVRVSGQVLGFPTSRSDWPIGGIGSISQLDKSWSLDPSGPATLHASNLRGFQNKGFDLGESAEFKGIEGLGPSGKLTNFPGLGTRGIFFGGNQFERLLKSLTPRQKSLEDDQGYLKITDLTPDQQRMLGVTDATQEIEIKYQKCDGTELVIKSE